MTKTENELLADEIEALPVRTEILNVDTGETGRQDVVVPIAVRDRILTALRTEQPASPASDWFAGEVDVDGNELVSIRADELQKLRDEREKFMWQVRDTCTRAEKAEAALSRPSSESDASVELRTLDEWHEDYGNVVWWKFPVDEPAWIGTPNDSHWPGYHTHWTPHPAVPTLAKLEQGGAGDAE